ncbi:MAG: hypothetical protein QW356_04875, partial [Candidatus Hadarchaeales archaeon]
SIASAMGGAIGGAISGVAAAGLGAPLGAAAGLGGGWGAPEARPQAAALGGLRTMAASIFGPPDLGKTLDSVAKQKAEGHKLEAEATAKVADVGDPSKVADNILTATKRVGGEVIISKFEGRTLSDKTKALNVLETLKKADMMYGGNLPSEDNAKGALRAGLIAKGMDPEKAKVAMYHPEVSKRAAEDGRLAISAATKELVKPHKRTFEALRKLHFAEDWDKINKGDSKTIKNYLGIYQRNKELIQKLAREQHVLGF